MVQFSLNRVDPAFLDKLQIGIVPKHLLEGKDLNTAGFNKNPIGTGPYVFEEWRPSERIVISANPDYFDGTANIERVVFSFVEDGNARAAMLANGSIDGEWPPSGIA